MKSQVRSSTVDWFDRTAVAGSVVCLVHCLALPLFVAAMPAVSSLSRVPASFHLWVLALTCPVAMMALVQGRLSHGAAHPVLLGTIGLLAIACGIIVLEEGWLETAVTVSGSLLLALAHLLNWWHRRRCCG